MYYVYAYLDTTQEGPFIYQDFGFTHLPIYIGKGTGNRVDSHIKEALSAQKSRSYKSKKVERLVEILDQNNFPKVQYIWENLSEDEAFFGEWLLIKLIKRYSLGGPLLNEVDGQLPKRFDSGLENVISNFGEEYFRIGRHLK